jgi:cytochrome b involved in lipid metabolism
MKKTISKEEVSNHNKKEDCYTIIDDKVYDLTNFF